MLELDLACDIHHVSSYGSCDPASNLDIVSAPLWDSKDSKFAGLLTTSDYINVIQYYFKNTSALAQVDQLRLSSLREVEKALGVQPPETISIDPEKSVYEACRRMLQSRARRIPLVTKDSQTQRPFVLSVITQYRILKFVAVNVPETQMLRKPLRDIGLGIYGNIVTATLDTTVKEIIHKLVDRSMSSVPIVSSRGKGWNIVSCFSLSKILCSANMMTPPGTVYNVFEAVDVITLIKGGAYEDLNLRVGEALLKRAPVCSFLTS